MNFPGVTPLPLSDTMIRNQGTRIACVMAAMMLAGAGMVRGQAPILLDSFTGFNYNDNITEVGGASIPPDPMGAAGPDRLIAVGNRVIEMRAKDGTLLALDSLRDFFATAPNNLGTGTFDPKVIYDPHEDRFVVVTLERVDTGNVSPANQSRILVAVSRTSMPATLTAADWYYMGIDSEETIAGIDRWADYPGFEVDEEAIYITNNMFAFDANFGIFGGVRLWIVDKGTGGGFYDGGVAEWEVYNPYANDGTARTTMPALVYGDTGIGPDIGTFLVSYSGNSNGDDEFIQVVRVDDPLGTPEFTVEDVNIGDIENAFAPFPNAPQPMTSALIWTNDRRALDCVWRNDQLWMVMTVIPGDGPNEDEATAYWVKMDTSAVVDGDSGTGLIESDDGGEIGGENIAAGTFTFFPSVAVNGAGAAMFGFAAAGPTVYGGSYVTGRLSTDEAGTVRPVIAVQEGVDYYERTFGGTRNRWGDYSGISVDPADDTTFWTFNEWAETRGNPTGGEDGRWGTAWGHIDFTAAPNSPPTITSAVLSPTPRALDDEDITLPASNIEASDPDGDPIGFAYIWEESADGIDFYFIYPDGDTFYDRLPASRTKPGYAYRACVTAIDQFGAFSDPPFCTDYTFVDSQPIESGAVGEEYCFDVELFVERPKSVGGDNRVLINEFSQGYWGNREWFEFVTTQDVDMRGWTIHDAYLFWDVRFNQNPLWANVPKGSIVLIYNGEEPDSQLPPDDYSFTDGTQRVVIGSTNSAYLNRPNSGTGWGAIIDNIPGNAAIRDPGMHLVDAFSLNGDTDYPPTFPLPNIGEFPSRSAIACIGAAIDDYDDPARWVIGPWNVVTPGAANGTENATFIQGLSDNTVDVPLNVALYSFGAGTSAIPGLNQGTDIDPLTGVIKFTPTAPGVYTVVVNREAPWGSNTPNYTYTLTVGLAPPAAPLSDGDGDGAVFLAERALNTDPSEANQNWQPTAAMAEMASGEGEGEMADFLTLTFTELKGGTLDAGTLEYTVAHPDYPGEKVIVYRVECSTDLNTWHSGPAVVVRDSVVDDPSDPGTAELVTFRTSSSLEAEACQFLRVVIEERDVAP